MKASLIRIAIRSLTVAILLTAMLTSTAFAGDDAKTICEGNGGMWIAIPDSSNGVCVLPVNNAVTLANCLPGEFFEQNFASDAPTGGTCYTPDPTDGSAPHGENQCVFVYGGTWEDLGTEFTCTVTHSLIGDCGSGATTTYFYDSSNMFTGFTCSDGGSGGQSGTALRNPGYSKHGGKIKNDSAGSAHLGGDKNGSFYYNEGTCAVSCIFTPNLPAGAAASLPSDAVATLYIRLADGGTGSYTVCFDATGISSPIIYQVISGVWTTIPTFSSGGQICATASGDGAFALGGN